MCESPSNAEPVSLLRPEPGAAGRAGRIERGARIRFAVAQGLAQGRIRFDFQPVVRATRRGFPAFHEMLARLVLPNGKVLPAGGFMPFVEDGAIGRAIDRLALSRAIEALTRAPLLRLAVNMSPLSMGDERYLRIIERAAERHPGALGRLILEITETAALRDIGTTLEFMGYARGHGIAFALDDFGAGATGFRHFRDFRFDIVKIDGAFVRGVAEEPDCQVLIECLLAVAKHFEMFTVAESVETEADADWLTRLGVDCLQGHLMGAPGPEITEDGKAGERAAG